MPARAESNPFQPYPGITLIERRDNNARGEPVVMHIATVDLTNPHITLALTEHAGSRETRRETTLNFLKEQHAQLAINVAFFTHLPKPVGEVEIMVYEICTEGTPVTPAFPDTPEGRLAMLAYCAEEVTTLGRYKTGVEGWAATHAAEQQRIISEILEGVPAHAH